MGTMLLVNHCCCSEREKLDDDFDEKALFEKMNNDQKSEKSLKMVQIDRRNQPQDTNRNHSMANNELNSLMTPKQKSQKSIRVLLKESSRKSIRNDSMMSYRSQMQNSEAMSMNNRFLEFEQDPKIVMRSEKKYEWNKQYLMRIFEEIVQIPTFKSVQDTPNVRMWINEKGTPFYNKIPIIKTVYTFDPKYSMNDIVGAIHTDQRLKWDPYIESKRLVRSVNRVNLVNITLKQHQLDTQKRDTFEKKFSWFNRPTVSNSNHDLNNTLDLQNNPEHSFLSARSQQNNAFDKEKLENYFFYSSMDSKDSKLECPEVQGTTRTHVIFGMDKFEIVKRERKGDEMSFATEGESCVQITRLFQCDPKLSKMKFAIYRTAMPSVTNKFYNDLVKYLDNK